MPSIAAHMVVAKLVSECLQIDDLDFIRGNLLPDIINLKDSHHKIKGKYFLIPDLDYFKKHLDLNNHLYLGYYVHLLLDKYFLEDFVIKNISNLNVFKDRIIYHEYDMINYGLVKLFNLDVDKMISILSVFDENIDEKKLNYNLQCLLNKVDGETIYLKLDDFADFLYSISKTISEEVQMLCK